MYRDYERGNYYHTSLICLNGHVIEDRIDTHPEKASSYCPRCSEPTISACPNCEAPIRGDYEIEGVCGMAEMEPAPNYCYKCGEPFPWTGKYLEAAKQMAAELEELTEEEKELLQESIAELVKDTPEAQLAATRFNRLLGKVKKAGDPLRELMIQIVAETTKRMISP